MKDILFKAGWEEELGFPKIAWDKYEAIIIAPKTDHENKEMVFYGLFREKNSLVLNYGWEKPQTDVEDAIEQGGTSTRTYGSSSFNEPSAIVVWFPKVFKETASFIVRNVHPNAEEVG